MTHSKSEVTCYVLDVTFFGEYGWTSVHTTYEGAQARLEEKVDEYDVRDAYQAAQFGSGNHGSTAAGDEGDMVVWGISKLPLETP